MMGLVTDGAPPPAGLVDDLLRRALAEDLGLAGDLTSDAIFPPDHASTGTIVARQAGRVAGLGLSTGVFALLAAESKVALTVADGDDVAAATTLATVSGPTRALLAGERTCLNLLGRLCGIATATADMVHRVEGTGVGAVCAGSCRVFPLCLGRQPVAVSVVTVVHLLKECLRIPPTDVLHRKFRCFELAGIVSHHRLPLRLSYFVFSNLESLGDSHRMRGLLVVVAFTVVCGATHQEFAGLDLHELHCRDGLPRKAGNCTPEQQQANDAFPHSVLRSNGLHYARNSESIQERATMRESASGGIA